MQNLQDNPMVSIITVVYNREDTIRECIDSVLAQDYPEIEYIIVDGKSTDSTPEIIKSYGDSISKWLSETDSGMYDALNKGIRMAKGEIIGILNSDDFYVDSRVISDVVDRFRTDGVESVFADIVFVDKDDISKTVRRYSSKNFNPEKFAFGFMPAHPSFFTTRMAYERCGLFSTNYKIAADFELLVRFLKKSSISYSYIPRVLVKMRTGGISTKNLKSNWILNREILRACSENGIKTNMLKILSKYFTKIFQLIPGEINESVTPRKQVRHSRRIPHKTDHKAFETI